LELECACLAGGFDNAPTPTEVRIAGRELSVSRQIDESGYLITPWDVSGVGRLMTSTATLMERPEAYLLPLELARGKVHQIRNHVAEWRFLGISPTADQEDQIRELSRAFAGATAAGNSDEGARLAQDCLRQAFLLSESLLPYYADKFFGLRHERFPN